jgi:hypothetical protein
MWSGIVEHEMINRVWVGRRMSYIVVGDSKIFFFDSISE